MFQDSPKNCYDIKAYMIFISMILCHYQKIN